MKKYTLLFAAFVTATASLWAGAPETPTVALPAYVVEAPRRNELERKIDTSLAEFRRSAGQVITPANANPLSASSVSPDRASKGQLTADRPAAFAFRVAVKA